MELGNDVTIMTLPSTFHHTSQQQLKIGLQAHSKYPLITINQVNKRLASLRTQVNQDSDYAFHWIFEDSQTQSPTRTFVVRLL